MDKGRRYLVGVIVRLVIYIFLRYRMFFQRLKVSGFFFGMWKVELYIFFIRVCLYSYKSVKMWFLILMFFIIFSIVEEF